MIDKILGTIQLLATLGIIVGAVNLYFKWFDWWAILIAIGFYAVSTIALSTIEITVEKQN